MIRPNTVPVGYGRQLGVRSVGAAPRRCRESLSAPVSGAQRARLSSAVKGIRVEVECPKSNSHNRFQGSAVWSRNGNGINDSFPEIVDALSAVLDHREVVRDGEIVARGIRWCAVLLHVQRRLHVLHPPTRSSAKRSQPRKGSEPRTTSSTSKVGRRLSWSTVNHSPISASNIRASKCQRPDHVESREKHQLETIVAKYFLGLPADNRSRDCLKTPPLRANWEVVL